MTMLVPKPIPDANCASHRQMLRCAQHDTGPVDLRATLQTVSENDGTEVHVEC